MVHANSRGRPVRQQAPQHALEVMPRLFLGVQLLQMRGHVTANSMVAPEGGSCTSSVHRGRIHPLTYLCQHALSSSPTTSWLLSGTAGCPLSFCSSNCCLSIDSSCEASTIWNSTRTHTPTNSAFMMQLLRTVIAHMAVGRKREAIYRSCTGGVGHWSTRACIPLVD